MRFRTHDCRNLNMLRKIARGTAADPRQIARNSPKGSTSTHAAKGSTSTHMISSARLARPRVVPMAIALMMSSGRKVRAPRRSTRRMRFRTRDCRNLNMLRKIARGAAAAPLG